MQDYYLERQRGERERVRNTLHQNHVAQTVSQGMGQLKIPPLSCSWIGFLWWREGRVPWGNICIAPGPCDIRSDIPGHIAGGCSMKFNI